MKQQHPQTTSIALALLLSLVTTQMGCDRTTKPSVDSTNANQTRAADSEFSPLKKLTADQQQQKELAIAAKDKLFLSLMAELMTSMSAKGPAESISVCKTKAPEIAASVGQETGVRIGRTSFKLRNESNNAPDWANSFVRKRVEEPVNVALPNNELGVLMPIRLKATCTACHGSEEQILPEVKAAIESNYPGDAATGFAEGDIRGYFWVEVPKQ